MTPPTPDLEKTGAALSQEPLKLQVSNLGTVIKMVTDGRPDQFFGVFGRPLVQVDAQFDRSFRGEFLGPAHDEFFRVAGSPTVRNVCSNAMSVGLLSPYRARRTPARSSVAIKPFALDRKSTRLNSSH